MILVDANILLYAEDSLSPHHTKARRWWDEKLSGSEVVGLCWTVLNAFVRIATNRRVFENPLPLNEAITRVDTWLEQPCTRLLSTTSRHWDTLKEMLQKGQAVGPLVTDAHLATLAVSHGCVLYSSDSDFARFPKLKWKNPLA